MASDVAIANAALRKLGHSPITAFNENSKAARLANERFADLRDSLLEDHPWNFAMKRASLSASATDPVWKYGSAYPVPTDYIRMYEVNGEDALSGKWKVENGAVVTDLSAPIEVRYVYRVADANKMTAGFREALASNLASDWAEDLTGDNDVVVTMAQKSTRAVAKARSNDGQEGFPDELEADEWINARH
jgi:hypothetical protein